MWAGIAVARHKRTLQVRFNSRACVCAWAKAPFNMTIDYLLLLLSLKDYQTALLYLYMPLCMMTPEIKYYSWLSFFKEQICHSFHLICREREWLKTNCKPNGIIESDTFSLTQISLNILISEGKIDEHLSNSNGPDKTTFYSMLRTRNHISGFLFSFI